MSAVAARLGEARAVKLPSITEELNLLNLKICKVCGPVFQEDGKGLNPERQFLSDTWLKEMAPVCRRLAAEIYSSSSSGMSAEAQKNQRLIRKRFEKLGRDAKAQCKRVIDAVFGHGMDSSEARRWIVLANACSPFQTEEDTTCFEQFDLGLRAAGQLDEISGWIGSYVPHNPKTIILRCLSIRGIIEEMKEVKVVSPTTLEARYERTLASVESLTSERIANVWSTSVDDRTDSQEVRQWVEFSNKLCEALKLVRVSGEVSAQKAHFLERYGVIRLVEQCESEVELFQSSGKCTKASFPKLLGYMAAIPCQLDLEESDQFEKLEVRFKRVVELVRVVAEGHLLDVLKRKDDAREGLYQAAQLLSASGHSKFATALSQLSQLEHLEWRVKRGKKLGLTEANIGHIAALFNAIPAGSEVESRRQIVMKKIEKLLAGDRPTPESMREGLKWVRAARQMGLPCERQYGGMFEHALERAQHYLDWVNSGVDALEELHAWASILADEGRGDLLEASKRARELNDVRRRVQDAKEALEEENGNAIVTLFSDIPEGSLAAPLKQLVAGEVREILTKQRATSEVMEEGLKWARVAERMGLDPDRQYYDQMIAVIDDRAAHYLRRAVERAPVLDDLSKLAALREREGCDQWSKAVRHMESILALDRLFDGAERSGLLPGHKGPIVRFYRSLPDTEPLSLRKRGFASRVQDLVAKPREDPRSIDQAWKWSVVAQQMEVVIPPRLKREIDCDELELLLRDESLLTEVREGAIRDLILSVRGGSDWETQYGERLRKIHDTIEAKMERSKWGLWDAKKLIDAAIGVGPARRWSNLLRLFDPKAAQAAASSIDRAVARFRLSSTEATPSGASSSSAAASTSSGAS